MDRSINRQRQEQRLEYYKKKRIYLRRRIKIFTIREPDMLVPVSLERKLLDVEQEIKKLESRLMKPRADKEIFLKDVNSQWLKRAQPLVSSHRSSFDAFCRERWREITSSNRAYGISEAGQDVVEINEAVLKELGLVRIRFMQEGYRAPEAGVNLEFRTGESLPCKINENGFLQTTALASDQFSDEIRILLQTVVLSYYSDLVLPAIVVHVPHTQPKSRQPSRKETTASTKNHKIPLRRRRSYSERSDIQPSGIERAGSFVAPHRRLLPEGWHASEGQIREAAIAGVSLRDPSNPNVSYTFVRGHVRGGQGDKAVFKHSSSQVVLSDFLRSLGF